MICKARATSHKKKKKPFLQLAQPPVFWVVISLKADNTCLAYACPFEKASKPPLSYCPRPQMGTLTMDAEVGSLGSGTWSMCDCRGQHALRAIFRKWNSSCHQYRVKIQLTRLCYLRCKGKFEALANLKRRISSKLGREKTLPGSRHFCKFCN